jgi:hypothetical protein
MLKILYAAANNSGAKLQLSRFLNAMSGKPYIIKTAAYIKSSPRGVSIDWTLDCLLNIYKPELLSLDNDNFSIYLDQVKYFAPDLIISDLEYFTSQVANILNVTLWQCSSSMLNFALTHEEKYNLGAFKHYSYTLNKHPLHTQRTVNLIDNSNCNFVYSHLGDIENSPKLKDQYEWIRPYHIIGKHSIPCRHNVVAATLSNNKRVIHLLKNHSDSVVFSDFDGEEYSNLLMKDIGNETEYACNLKNSNIFVCEGQSSFLADAFYNQKYSVILTDLKEAECILNTAFTEKAQTGCAIYDSQIDLDVYMDKQIINQTNETSKFLHERIMEL